MSDGLLQTKLFIPPLRPLLVSRNRLFEALKYNSHSKLTLISAPAGFGKTTLVVAWLSELQSQSTEQLACWYSLDDKDNELTRFLTYLLGAIRTAVPQFGSSLLVALQSAQPPNETAVTQTLLNQLADLNHPLVLVLDDYHLITNTAVHDVLTTLIEYLPPHIQFIMTSREDPPLPLPRWRVRGQLTEIRADDLRFNQEEAAHFFKQTMGLQLDPQDVNHLESRTEGWAAGLQLAALSLQGQADIAKQVSTFSGTDRHIADYLLAEVLDSLSAELQHFLQQTAVLDRLCAPLCEALLADTQNTHAQTLLERLEMANLFLIPLDNQRRWYRYHHLFAELLRERLLRDRGKTAVIEQHKRAASWFESQNLLEEAIQHAFYANDMDYAGQMIADTSVDNLWQQGGAAMVRQWVQALPTATILRYPLIAIRASSAHLIVGDIQQAGHYLSMVENVPEVDAEWHLLEAILIRNRGQIPQALEFAHYALENLDPDQHNLRAFAYLQLVSSFMQMSEMDEAEQVLGLMQNHFEQMEIGSQIYVRRMEGLIAANRADFQLAEEKFHEGVQLLGAGDQPLIGTLYNGLAFLKFHQYEMEEAAHYYRQAKQWADSTGITDILFDAYLGEAELACWRGEPQIALDIMARFRSFAHQSKLDSIIEISNLYYILFELKVGQIETAVQWANESELTVHDKPVFQKYGQYKLFVATLIRQSEQTGDIDPLSALAQLAEQLIEQFFQRDYIFDALDMLTWLALLYELNGERDKALGSLQSAIGYAEPSAIIQPFIAKGQTLLALLRWLPPSDFIKKIQQASSSGVAISNNDRLQDPLTEREQQVLACLVAGLSNKAIEEKLHISKNTVRTHLKNLYSKLDVNGRSQAIERARALELL